MALIVKDRVRETSTTTGTGTLTLAGAVTGFQSFSEIGDGNTTYYSIVDAQTGAWEVGIGTYTASGTTLSRDIVLESSNNGSLVNFGGGTKDVFCTYPAERSVFNNADNNLVVPSFANTTFNGSELETFIQWDSSADSYVVYASGETQIHRSMRRCLLLDNGTVNYYLDPNNSAFKENGAASVLTGADGQVMVEIPKFYVKKDKVSNLNTWFISQVPRDGYVIHPAFVKNGAEVNYRYIGAYDACVYDVSASAYISGLNYDNNSGVGNGVEVDVTASTGDVLASVSGVYPMVGLTRAEFRALAANRGAGWRQLDFYLWSAVQLLYLAEYGNFNSQLMLGAGNTATTYATSSGVQGDNGGSEAGKSNGFGNNSTNAITGASSSSRGVAFMSYRGIENLFGNEWNWVDGWNVLSYQSWVSNNDTQFADNTSTNYTSLGASLPTTSGQYITNVQNLESAFLPSSVGGSSTTYITDTLFIASGNRVVRVGGGANDAATAGAFAVVASSGSSDRSRRIGGRLAF